MALAYVQLKVNYLSENLRGKVIRPQVCPPVFSNASTRGELGPIAHQSYPKMHKLIRMIV